MNHLITTLRRFRHLIRGWLKETGRTQTELARESGVRREALTRMLGDHAGQTIYLSTLDRLTQAMQRLDMEAWIDVQFVEEVVPDDFGRKGEVDDEAKI